MTELLARTQDQGDQKILLPELLLAASQGKVPHEATVELVAEAPTVSQGWDEADRAPIELGLALARAASITPLPGTTSGRGTFKRVRGTDTSSKRQT